MKKQVLYLSYDGLTDALGQSQILPYLLGLEKIGHSFHIISFEKKESFAQFQAIIEEQIKGKNIRWHPLFYTKKPPVLSTLYDLKRMKNSAFSLQKSHHFDAIHCRSYLPGLIALKLKNKFACPFIFDMRGFWADERVEGKLWNVKHPIYRKIYSYIKRKEERLLSEADAIISLTNAGKKSVLTVYPQLDISTKISVIPCCVNQKLFTVLPENNEVLKSLGIDINKNILGYVGSLGTWYMLDEMLAFFKIQQLKVSNLHFLFLTKDSRDIVYAKAKVLGLNLNDITVVSVPYQKMPSVMKVIDYGLFFIRPSFSKQASSPIKQAEFMAMGIPVICNSGIGDTSEIILEHQSGFVFDELTHASFSSFSFDQIIFDKDKTLNAVNTIFSIEQGIKGYNEVYDTLRKKT
jgi:glycosyltransferase involved in cell wall biosynthesis